MKHPWFVSSPAACLLKGVRQTLLLLQRRVENTGLPVRAAGRAKHRWE